MLSVFSGEGGSEGERDKQERETDKRERENGKVGKRKGKRIEGSNGMKRDGG